MKTLEHITQPSWEDDHESIDEYLEREQRKSLVNYDKVLRQTDRSWCRFFDGGRRDERRTMWSVYNRWSDEIDPAGWKVLRCGDSETVFREISVSKVEQSIISKPSIEQRIGFTVFQLYIEDIDAMLTNNDILNVLMHYGDNNSHEVDLKMWDESSTMSATEWTITDNPSTY